MLLSRMASTNAWRCAYKLFLAFQRMLCRNTDTNKSLPPPPYDAQTQTLARLLVQLHSEGVPQLFLLVLGFIPVDRQPNPLGRLPQHVDGFIMAGCSQVNAVHLRSFGGEKKEKKTFINSKLCKFTPYS